MEKKSIDYDAAIELATRYYEAVDKIIQLEDDIDRLKKEHQEDMKDAAREIRELMEELRCAEATAENNYYG